MPKPILILAAITLCVPPAIADVSIDVIPAFGPDPTGLSEGGFIISAVSELRFPGSTTINRADDPTGYQVVPEGPNSYAEALSSVGLKSWRGQADPTLGWDDGIHTADVFRNEFGTRIYFGARITVDFPLTEDIRLSDLRGEIHWEEETSGGFVPSSVLTKKLTVDFSTKWYDQAVVGVDFGADGVPGGLDDKVYNATEFDVNNSSCAGFGDPCNTIPVDAIYLAGLADSIFVDTFGKLTDQEDLNEALRLLDNLPNQRLTASYSIYSVNNPGTIVTATGEVLFTQSSFDPGDYDHDGDVDPDDYAEWTQEFGLIGNWPADGNGNGLVDAADFTVWRDHYDATAMTAAVPEPGGLLLAVLAGLSVATLRWCPRFSVLLQTPRARIFTCSADERSFPAG